MRTIFWRRAAVLSIAVTAGMVMNGCSADRLGDGAADGRPERGSVESAMVSGTDQKDAAESSGRGRYVEKTVLKAEHVMDRIHLSMLADGQPIFLNYLSGQRFCAVDGGDIWEVVEDEEFARYADENYGIAAAIYKDGTVAVINMIEKQGQEALEHPEYDHLLNIWQTDGTVRNIPVELPESTARLYELTFGDDGKLFVYADVCNAIFEVDIESGTVRKRFSVPDRVEVMDCRGGILMCAGNDRIYLYDLEEDRLMEDEVLNDLIEKDHGGVNWSGSGFSAYPFLGEDGSIYVAGPKGLYRHVINGDMVEQVIDGSLSSLGDPSHSIMAMIENDDQEFFAAFSDGTVVRYTYDADVSAVPEGRLTIYSLEEDAMVRQAIAAYHTACPDLYLDYEIGMDGDGITREDALKKLNTRLLSGEGPDVLILDGMDIDTYVEKGVLLDLSDVVFGVDQSEGLYTNLIEPFSRDGALFAVPMQFRIPMIGGHREVMRDIKDLRSIADMLEEEREKSPNANLLGVCSDSGIMKRFLPVCASSWKTEDGQLDEEKIREFLQQVKRIYDVQMNGTPQEYIVAYQQNVRADGGEAHEANAYFLSMLSTFYYEGESPFMFGELMDAFGYLDIISAPKMEGFEDTVCQKMTGQCANVYHPTVIVGINAATEDPEQAMELVRSMLSRSVQDTPHEGLPINKGSLAEQFAYDEEELGDDGGLYYMSSSGKDGKRLEMVIYPAQQEDIEELDRLIGQLDTPYLPDAVLEDVVLTVGGRYLSGDMELDEAVRSIKDRMAVYIAE